MSNTLLPCPFCGGEAGFKHIFENPEKCMAGCRECDLVIDAIFSNECEALAAWNSRTGKDINVATNADRIRGMSDEELALFLNKCESAGYNDDSIADKMSNGYPMDMLDWLKQPVKEEHHEAD